ncbi:MAG: hypothetical protein PUF98_09710 [Oscillibacter sp.]|nr:hypothetical protein [Oscillibacter sp.]
MKRTVTNYKNKESVAIIKIHEDYCGDSNKELLEQLSVLLQNVYMKRMEETEKQM